MIYKINPRYKRLTSFIKSLPETFPNQGELIYKDDDEVRSFEVEGFSIVVKQYKLPTSFWERIFLYYFHSKAANAFRYAKKVTQRGFNTPDYVAYLNQSTLLILLKNCYYVSLLAPIMRDMREFGDGNTSGKEHILKGFGRFLAQLHESDIYFPKYSPGNIGFEETSHGVRFTLLNINKAKFKRVNKRKAYRAFRTLPGTEEMLRFIIEEYSYIRGYNAQDMMRKAMKNCEKYQKMEEIRERQSLKGSFLKRLGKKRG